jgi:signal transduction histidine kinase
MKLATQIFLGFLIAISIDLLDSFVNYSLTLKVKRISDFLNHSEDVIRHSGALDKGVLDAQNAFRGFLLTGDTEFLAVYDQDQKDLTASATAMRKMVALPTQKIIVDSITVLYNRWVGYADGLIEAMKKASADVGTSGKFKAMLDREMSEGIGKRYNVKIGALFRSFDNAEYLQRDLRRKELRDSIARTDRYSLLFSILLVLIGLAIAGVLVRKISRRINTLVKLAERISRGDFGRVKDNKRDELSGLSNSLNIMSEKLSRNINDLEKKNAELNQFAHVVSHDLKAPIRGISNVVRWIEEDHAAEIGPKIRKYLDIIPERISRMEGLIDGLIEYARAGREGVIKESVDVGKMIGDLTELAVPEGFIVEIGRLPELITERLPLQQVFSNLIDNSVKYGTAGKTIIVVDSTDCGEYYEFSVADNGPGIAAEYHEKIFGLFQTLREKTDKESTGIGLSIVKKIVGERGGQVRVDSSPGNGAIFIFTWTKNS